MTRLLLILTSISFCFHIFSETELVNYQIKKNDTLFSIANKFNTSLDNIYSLNPDIGLSQDYIREGATIIIPFNNEYDYLNFCSETGGILDSKNIELSLDKQISDCIKYLSTKINIKYFNNVNEIDWNLVEKNKLYQVFINNKVASLIRKDFSSSELKKYIFLLHESAKKNNEISIMGLYAHELLLDELEIPPIQADFPEKYFISLPPLAELRKEIFTKWDNMKYHDPGIYEALQNKSINFDLLCEEVLLKPQTNIVYLLLEGNLRCASYYDSNGSKNWKKHTDRVIEIIKKYKTRFIYPTEYRAILEIMYYADINNITEYYEGFLKTFTEIKCPSCNEPEDLLDMMEAYEAIGSASYEQTSSMRYIRGNHIEYLAKKNNLDVSYITSYGDDLLRLIENDIKDMSDNVLIADDINFYISNFQITYLDAISSIVNQLVNQDECKLASKYYERYLDFDFSIINEFFYYEQEDADFLLAFNISNCFLAYSDENSFYIEDGNFNMNLAKEYLELGSLKLSEYIKFSENLDKISVDEEPFYKSTDTSNNLIYRAYRSVLQSYIFYLEGNLPSSKGSLDDFNIYSSEILNQPITPSLYKIIDYMMVLYIDIYVNLNLDESYPDPVPLKLHIDKVKNQIKFSDSINANEKDFLEFKINKIQENLNTDEHSIVFFNSSLSSRILLISSDDLDLYEATGSIEINFYLDSIRDSLNMADDSFDFESARYLYDVLIFPYEKKLKKDSVIKIIGSDFMSVPFSVLLKSYDESEKNFHKKIITSDWALKHYNFVRIFNKSNKKTDNFYEENFLGYANPTSYQWSGLPDLFESKREVTKLGIASNAKKELIFTNKDATKEKFLKQFNKSYKRVVIATHAVPPFWNGATFEPSLLFRSKSGDFFLTPSEITEYSFSSDMIVLSACNTSSNSFIGLFDAFIIAGAKSVVHSNWNLESKFASSYTTAFFEELWVNENPKHIAMRDVALSFMNNYSDLNYIHPAFWANFSIIYSDI